ncbi:MAG: hypothetical protein ACFB9M_17790 [Myxococcota bacterium]
MSSPIPENPSWDGRLRPLAYVFWHWPSEDTDRDSYEEAQVSFHQALRSDPPSGFIGSRSYAATPRPWSRPITCYEDWYLIEDFTALGALNVGAVTRGRRVHHDQAAAAMAAGAGGLYRLRHGSRSTEARFAHWFHKPRGLDAEAFITALRPIIDRAGGELWMRQLVLGPAPEWCLQLPAPAELPNAHGLARTELRRLWPQAPTTLT